MRDWRYDYFTGGNTMSMYVTPEAARQVRQTKVRLIYNALQNTMLNLVSRWLDESEYEDIADYAKIINKELEQYNLVVLKMSKRPFGFTFVVNGHVYAITLSANGAYTCKSVKS
jgi:hypothetical protein